MTAEDIETLRGYMDKLVRITTTDGEEMVVKLTFFFDEYQDFVCDILSTNRQTKYKAPLNSAAYTISYNDIDSFSLVTV